jgi:hypothetical protein
MGQSDFCSNNTSLPKQANSLSIIHLMNFHTKIKLLPLSKHYFTNCVKIKKHFLIFLEKTWNWTLCSGRAKPYFLAVQALGIWGILISLCRSFRRQATHLLDDLKREECHQQDPGGAALLACTHSQAKAESLEARGEWVEVRERTQCFQGTEKHLCWTQPTCGVQAQLGHLLSSLPWTGLLA